MDMQRPNMTKSIYIYDHITGEEIIREPNTEELANLEAGKLAKEQRIAAETQMQTKKNEALDKLIKLGLSQEDLQALGL